MVEVVETSSDGRGRLHVMFLYQVRVVGTVGGALRGSGQDLVFAVHVYMNPDGKGLIP